MYSVIIPLFNKRESILGSVESVLKETYSDFELIIVNDGSTDGSEKLVESLTDKRLRVINQSNEGVSAARNRGIREASHDLIAFLDADDRWEPDYLEKMSGLIEEFPGAGLYGCAYDKISVNAAATDPFPLPAGFRGMIDDYFSLAVDYHMFCSSAVIVRKSAIEQSGCFDERIAMGEDLDLWFRIALDHNVAFYNKVLAHYDMTSENRAMKKKHPYTKSILCYTAKFKEYEPGNKAFRFFINYFRITKIPELLLKYNPGRDEINEYFSLIDPEGQFLKYRVFLKLPLFLLKIIAISYYKYRGLE